jgi:hypothetical protein
MQHVMMLFAILTITLFNGCCPQPKPCPIIPQRCIVPITDEPVIDNLKCVDGNYSCIISKALLNYEAMKAYAKELKINGEVCR